MKKVLLLVVAALTLGLQVNAQKAPATQNTQATTGASPKKLGYLNSQELLSAMPEYKKVNEDLEAYYKQLEADFAELSKEYQNKMKDYEDKVRTLSESMKEVKQKEIMALQQNIEDFRTSSQEKLSKKEAELVNPLLKKIQDAIDAVGKENNFDYIYNESALLYAKDSENITPLVKAKLGIK
ncbi:MAG: hypothetical protein BGO09_02915 [Bacteroidetes bacterium 47-18]|nr:MAG: hypothetical protein BGO09_02915 [Bacteroidetes bacterium 47-18]